MTARVERSFRLTGLVWSETSDYVPTMDNELLSEIEVFRKRAKLPETTFGRRAIGDANLIANLRDGRELRRATTQRVRDFMVAYAPTPEQAAAA